MCGFALFYVTLGCIVWYCAVLCGPALCFSVLFGVGWKRLVFVVLRGTEWHCVVLFGVVWCRVVVRGIVWYRVVVSGIEWYCVVLCGIGWYCEVLRFGVWYFAVHALHCAVSVLHLSGIFW